MGCTHTYTQPFCCKMFLPLNARTHEPFIEHQMQPIIQSAGMTAFRPISTSAFCFYFVSAVCVCVLSFAKTFFHKFAVHVCCVHFRYHIFFLSICGYKKLFGHQKCKPVAGGTLTRSRKY